MADAFGINPMRGLADAVYMDLSEVEIRLLLARVHARQLLPGDQAVIATIIREFIAEVEAGRASVSDLYRDYVDPSLTTVES